MAWPTKEQKEAKRLAELDKPAAAPAAQSLDMAAIAALIRDTVADSIASLREELAEVKSTVPRIVPREAPPDLLGARKAAVSGMVAGQEREGVISSIPTDYRGHTVASAQAQRFKVGDAVRFRPDMKREGFPKAGDPSPAKYDIDIRGRKKVSRDWSMWSRIFPDLDENGGTFSRDVTWGDILRANRSNGVGTVAYPGVMSRIGVWKYRVKVPGITQENGDSAYEYELAEAV